MRFSLTLLLLSLSCLGQPLTFGVKGGGRLTADYVDYGHMESKRYLIGGPMLAFEVDALYSRSGRSDYIPLIGNETVLRTRANSWEFPLLAKCRLPTSHVQPYLAAGIDPRASNFREDATGYRMVTNHAWLAAAGLEIHAGHIHISPEVRYLWWNYPRNFSAGLTSYIPRPRNEIQLLVGIGWDLSR